jgi:hypothetical protein
MSEQLPATFVCGKNSRDVFVFRLTDRASGGNLIEVEIEPTALIMALTGYADGPCVYSVNPTAVSRAGKRRVTRTVGIDHAEASERSREFQYLKADHPHRPPLVEAFNRWALFEAIKGLPVDDQRIPAADWFLAINGIGTKQDSGTWKVTLCRFEEIQKES